MSLHIAEQKGTGFASSEVGEPRSYAPLEELDMDVTASAAERTAERSRIVRIASHEWAVALVYLFLDFVAWIAIYGAISFLRREAFHTTPLGFFLIEVIQLAIIVQALYIIGGYDRKVDNRSLAYAAEHILAIGAAAVISAMIIYSAATFDATMHPSRAVLLFSFLTFLPVSLYYRRWIRKYVAASFANRAFLVIGAGEAAKKLYESYQNSVSPQRLQFVDVTNKCVGIPIAGEGSPIVQGNLADKLRKGGQNYSGIILAENIKVLSTRLLDGLVRTQFQRMRVYTLESFYETHWRYVPLEAVDPVWPLQTGFQLARISPYHYLKRLCDIALAGGLLVICCPLMALIVAAIWLESRGPVFFWQQRIGREGKQFTVYKFRTMRASNEKENGDIYTRKGDPRITRVGKVLRKLRLDELPQLWNVWNGEMSLIGPRAEWTRCAEIYEKKIPFYHFRHLVKPGITGWAQVNYPYGESEKDALEKLKYDLYYIRHYSLKLDAMIALKTIYVMVFGGGR
jgi:exopolysaccharide biosynthesis polyprenyl glycosylphosphotransferase